jgi:hypothetical protein
VKGFCVSTIHTSDQVDDLKAAALLSNTLLKLDMTEALSDYAELDCESVSGALLMAGGNDMFSSFLTLLGATYGEQLGKGNGELQHYTISVFPRNTSRESH